ncbi:hypothetical protein AB595_18195 [Massilia sp. WF1]|nr:hypothetical protein AM586_17855 [Massilia sp. WG5]KLU35456.1 hypothetical protein AB595_18195 [Massilia sp. WF1]
MRALLDDASMFHDDDGVGVHDGRQPVRDDQDAALARQPFQFARDRAFRYRIQGRGRLVEDQDRRVLQDRAGDADALPFAAREHHAALADRAAVVEAKRSSAEAAMRPR